MRLYTVHLRPGDPASEAVLVKEGFCWPALFLGPLWAFARRMWLEGFLWLAVAASIAALARIWPDYAGILGVAGLGLVVLFAAEGNELRRRQVVRAGYRETGVVGGPDKDAAARRFADLAAIGRT